MKQFELSSFGPKKYNRSRRAFGVDFDIELISDSIYRDHDHRAPCKRREDLDLCLNELGSDSGLLLVANCNECYLGNCRVVLWAVGKL